MSPKPIQTLTTNQTSLRTNQIQTTRIRTKDTIHDSRHITRTNSNTEELHSIGRKFLFNGRGVDATQLHSLNELSIKATEVTEETQTALI